MTRTRVSSGGRRRYHDPEPCDVCGRKTATLVPWHGDGSLVRFVAHGPVKNRCPGSRQVPKSYERPEWLR